MEFGMKRAWFISGITLLILLIVAGFILIQSTTSPIAVRAQEPEENPRAEKILEIVVERNINGEVTSGEVQVRFEDPDDLPERLKAPLESSWIRKGILSPWGPGASKLKWGLKL